MQKSSRVAQLRQQGFDRSYAIPFERAWYLRCSQCEALAISGIPTHEQGCPNGRQARQDEEGEED